MNPHQGLLCTVSNCRWRQPHPTATATGHPLSSVVGGGDVVLGFARFQVGAVAPAVHDERDGVRGADRQDALLPRQARQGALGE